MAGLLGPELTALLDAPAAGPERDVPLWRAEAVASVFARNRDRLALLYALAQRASAAYTALLAGVFEQAEAHVPDQDLEDAGKELTRETTLLFGLTPKRTEVLLDVGLTRTRFPRLHEAHTRGLLEARHVEGFLRGVGGVALS
ncbi:MAG: hypothetical protein Q4E05_06010, partial [Pseudoclavibacter sp.]|nr:hypothetical protein [Pseudoclavibacter sp.]